MAKSDKRGKELDRKTFTYLVAILAVIVVVLVAKKLHGSRNAFLSDSAKNETESMIEQTENTEEVSESKGEDSLIKGNYIATIHTDGQNFSKDSNNYFEYKASFYTVASKKGDGDAIENINREIESFVEGEKEKFKALEPEAKDYYETTVEKEGKDNFRPYDYLVEAKLLRNDDKIFSLVFYTVTYLGGQHGFSESHCMNFDAKTGKRLEIKDLQSPLSSASVEAFENDLLAYMEKDADKREELNLFDDYKEHMREVLLNDSSWALTADGLQFVADPYELAPYASGMLVFTIPTEDIYFFNEEYAFSKE